MQYYMSYNIVYSDTIRHIILFVNKYFLGKVCEVLLSARKFNAIS